MTLTRLGSTSSASGAGPGHSRSGGASITSSIPAMEKVRSDPHPENRISSGDGSTTLRRGTAVIDCCAGVILGHLAFTILQRLSPDEELADVVQSERKWKERLHTRAPHGLNDN